MSSPDVVILKTLLESHPGFVSGNQLASELGISRVGVWARLEKLREADFGFEAIRHRGYRMVQQPTMLNEQLIQAYLESYRHPVPIIYLPMADSTNDHAEQHLAVGRPTPFVVISGQQRAGRGRLGRVWYSPPEGNLYASFAFRPRVEPARMRRITLWLGLHLCALLNREFDLPVRIKWPNDLLLEGRKVAGMLTEARIDADLTRDLVFGLGLNVNCQCKRWPRDFAAVATSLAEHSRQPLQLNQVAARVIQTIIDAYQNYMDQRDAVEIRDLWEQYDCLRGRTVTTRYDGGLVTGSADGIDVDGNLRVRLATGQTLLLNSGEVTLGSRR